MAYIVLSIISWKRLLENGLDDFGSRPRHARADLSPAHANLHLVRTENQPEVTLGNLFYVYFHVPRGVQ